MPNTLKHEDIYPGMRFFQYNYGRKNWKIIHIISGEFTRYTMVDQDDNVIPFDLEQLNEMDFLGHQTEPVQLGVAKCINDAFAFCNEGEIYPYFGSSPDGDVIIKNSEGDFIELDGDVFEIADTPKPETPKEVTVDGHKYTLDE